MPLSDVIFYMFSTVLIGSGLAVISMRNPVHSVLFLILCFFNAAGLFVLLGAEFLAMLLVIVYVGAVAVLFLFVVMMLNVSVEQFRKGLTRYFPVGAGIALLLFGEFAYLFWHWADSTIYGSQISKPIPGAITNTEALGRVLYTDYMLLFQLSGLVLLVAMIGAIVLTFTPRNKMRKQNIGRQVSRRPRDTMEIVKVQTGKGIE